MYDERQEKYNEEVGKPRATHVSIAQDTRGGGGRALIRTGAHSTVNKHPTMETWRGGGCQRSQNPSKERQ
jgi:hypothetical protein